MTYKLIIFDLDHTLLREDHTLSETTIDTVGRCQKAGIGVTLATGRRLPSALPYARQLGLTLPVITCQGAMLSTLDGQILHQCLMAPALAHQLLAQLTRYPLENIICCHDDQIYATQARPDAPDPAGWIAAHPQHTPMPDDLGAVHPLKIGASGDPEVIAQAQADIAAAFGQTVHAVQSSPYFLEITHPQATKSAAAARLAQLLAIDPSEIIAFGDSMNDLDLLQFAGCSVAVANAVPAVRSACAHITESNEQDGVARALKRLLFSTKEDISPWITD